PRRRYLLGFDDLAAVERQRRQFVDANGQEQSPERPMRAELPDSGHDVAHTGDEPQSDHFFPRHQNPEDIAPAEPRESEEDHGIGNDLGRIDQIESARKAQNKPITVYVARWSASGRGSVPVRLKVMR